MGLGVRSDGGFKGMGERCRRTKQWESHGLGAEPGGKGCVRTGDIEALRVRLWMMFVSSRRAAKMYSRGSDDQNILSQSSGCFDTTAMAETIGK